MIEIKKLLKSFGSNHVLKGVDLEFSKGTISGIVGKNGAGKTTLFKCISNLETYEGEINSDFDKLKNHIGYLPTMPYLMPYIKGKEYLQLLCNARKIETPNFEEKNIFDLPLESYANTYSTGMKKKLALTGVLLQKNDVFILDEPFNGVDIQSNFIITKIINKLKETNKTIIISSHILESLKSICDQVHLLENGIISKSLSSENFSALEIEMSGTLIDEKINKLF